MTTAIPKQILIDEYINKTVRVLVDEGEDEPKAYEHRLVGVTSDPDGNVCLTLADVQNKADPDFIFVDGDDVIRIEVPSMLGPTVVYVREEGGAGDAYAFNRLDDPATIDSKVNGETPEKPCEGCDVEDCDCHLIGEGKSAPTPDSPDYVPGVPGVDGVGTAVATSAEIAETVAGVAALIAEQDAEDGPAQPVEPGDPDDDNDPALDPIEAALAKRASGAAGEAATD